MTRSNDQFKKNTEQHAAQAPALRERIYPSTGQIRPELMSQADPKNVEGRSSQAAVCFKIDKAQRHQYSTFDVGRSMFDVRVC